METAETISAVKNWLGAGSINIFGSPYAGKDTHGHRLAAELGAELMGGGDILRSSQLPDDVKSLHRTGQLFPTDVYFRIVLPYLKQEKFAGKPLILSSVGRRQGEESVVLEAAEAAGHPLKAVIYLMVDDKVVWERWEHSDSRQNRGEREDDAREILEVRLAEFRDKTLPVIDFYREKGLLIEIDSNRAKDTVTKDILDKLFDFSKK